MIGNDRDNDDIVRRLDRLREGLLSDSVADTVMERIERSPGPRRPPAWRCFVREYGRTLAVAAAVIAAAAVVWLAIPRGAAPAHAVAQSIEAIDRLDQ